MSLRCLCFSWCLVSLSTITTAVCGQGTLLPGPGPAGKEMPKKADHEGHGKEKGDAGGDHKGHGGKDENPLPHPPYPPVDRGPIITLEELEFLALQNNPTLVQASMQIEASRAKALQAKLWPNPVVGYSAEQIGVARTAGEFQGGFIQQEIITGFKRKLSAEKYRIETQTAEFKSALQQLKVVNGVKVQYFRTLSAGRAAMIRQALFENAEEEYRTTLELFNIGRKDKAQVLLAENRRNKARIDAATEKNRYQYMWRALAALVGVPDLKASAMADTLENANMPLDYDSSLARLLHESPELMVARSHIAFEELSLKRERREPIPNITVRGAVGYNAEAKQTVADAQVSIPLPLWNRNQGNIRMVQADLQRAIAEVRRIELSLQSRLAQEFNKYQNSLSHAQIYQKENLPNAKQAYEIYLDQYKKRRIGWDEVVRMHRNWLEVQLEYTNTLTDLRQQEALITGLLVQDGLTEPPGPTPPGHISVSPQPR